MKHLNFLSSWYADDLHLTSRQSRPDSVSSPCRCRVLPTLLLCLTLFVGVGNVWASVTTTASDPAPAGTYKAMVSGEAVVAGDTVIIISGSVAMSTTQNNSNRATTSVSVSNSTVTLTANTSVQALTVAASSVSGKWTLYTGVGYLYAPTYSGSGSNNYLKTETTDKSGSGGDWSISYNEVKATGTNRVNMRLNGSIISCYASGQTAISVYKKAHKVSYKGNGGSTSCSDNTFYKSNETVTLCASEPTRSNYNFTGWTATIALTNASTSATIAAGSLIAAGTQIKMPAKDVVLTAQWESAASSDPALELTGSGAFGNVDANDTKELNFTLTGENLTANASVSVSGTGFSLVTPSNGTLTQTAGSITGSNNITVRFAPTAGGAHNGTLTVSSDGAEDVSVSLSGTGQLSDTFIDELHSTSGYTSGSPHVEKGSYGTTPKITDKAVATSGTCAQQHYHFVGWITAAKYEAGTAIAAGDLQKPTSATGATYYAVWAKKGAEGSDNEELTNNELKTNVTNTQRAYDTAKTHSDGDIDYTFNVYTDAANRPWVQLKSADPSAIKIEAPGNISRVDMTITSATNSSGGVADITKHDAFSTAGTISLRSTSRTGTVVASNTGANVSDNVLSITVSSPANSTLYLTTSTGCRIWGITVYYSTVSYTDYRAVCCNELGSINGSFFWSTLFEPLSPDKFWSHVLLCDHLFSSSHSRILHHLIYTMYISREVDFFSLIVS